MMFQMFLALIINFLIVLLAIPILTKYLKARGEVGVERSGKHGFGVDTSAKNGTPSMGGLAFILSSLLSSLLLLMIFHEVTTVYLLILVSVFSYGVIGFIDDWLKAFYHRDDGFRFLPKLLSQIFSGLLTTLVLLFSGLSDQLTFAFLKQLPIYLLFEFIFYLVWFVGWSNAANFVDGIDGLLAGVAIIMFAGFALISWRNGSTVLFLFDVSLIGSLLAYLIFNKPKASIFMGDCGSMALGAAMAVNVIILGNPWSLLWFGLIPLIHTLSVMIQVPVYHFFHVRVFPVTPLQHAFQKIGWPEWRIDSLYWLIQFIITVIGVYVWIR